MMDAGVAESKGKRPYMEDRNVVALKLPTFSTFSLFGVFDGHGGSKASETIKELIVPTIETHIHKNKLMGLTDPEERAKAMKVVLHNSLLEVDTLYGTLYSTAERGGSTAIVAMVWTGKPPILAVANVGDCRALLVREDGTFGVLSQDHKPALPSERERIERLGGKIIHEPNNVCRVEGILAVSRAIGDFALKPYVIPDPDVTITQLTPNDRIIVLASDGLWDIVNNGDCAQQVSLSLAMTRSPTKAAHEMVRVVLQRGGVDNITCMVVSLDWNALIGQAQS